MIPLINNKLRETENSLVIVRGRVWGVGEMDKSGQKAQTSSYKISCGDVMNDMVTIVNNTVLSIQKLLRE